MNADPPDDALPPDPPPEPPPPPPKAPLPPLLEYPSPRPPSELETERWGDVARAVLIVFGSLAFLFFGVFGFCGLLGRGCG